MHADRLFGFISSQNLVKAARGLAFLYSRQTFAIHASIQPIYATLRMAFTELATNDLQVKKTAWLEGDPPTALGCVANSSATRGAKNTQSAGPVGQADKTGGE